ANRGLQAPQLVLNIADRQAWADEEALGLSETEFLILLWLAERAARGEQATDWSAQALAEEFLALAGRVLSSMSGAYERIEKAITERKGVTIRCAKYFEPHKSRINGKLETVLGARSAERYQIATSRDGERVTVFLPLKPEQITVQRG
ncbi:hypothetical protein CKO29_18250, partial [Allochromatium vinosum]|nr:hypothetical protein [Allochromatium vinosum]